MTFSNFWIWHAVKRSVVEGKCYFYYSIQAFTSNHCHFLESKNFDCPKMLPNRGKSLFILEQQAFACNNWLFKNVTKCSQMLAHRQYSHGWLTICMCIYYKYLHLFVVVLTFWYPNCIWYRFLLLPLYKAYRGRQGKFTHFWYLDYVLDLNYRDL